MPPKLYYKKVKKTDMQQHIGKKFSIPGSYWNGSTPEEQEELYPIEVVKIDAAHKFKGIRNAEPAFGFVLTRPEDQEHNPEGGDCEWIGLSEYSKFLAAWEEDHPPPPPPAAAPAPVPALETAEAADADLDAADEGPNFFENSRAAIRKCFRKAELVETKTNGKGRTTRKFKFVCRDEFHGDPKCNNHPAATGASISFHGVLRAGSSRRPSRHRRDVFSMAW